MLRRKVVLEWGPTDRGLVESLASTAGQEECVPRSAREDFASSDEVETLIGGCQAMQQYRPDRGGIVDPRPASSAFRASA